MIYLDTSALAKLVVDEPESAHLATWLDARPDEVLVTSVLGRVELLRAARRHSAAALPAALGILAELALVPLTPDVIDGAWSLDPPGLRSLDAIHVASAASLPGETTLLAYDSRLLAAARAVGLTALAPGDAGAP